MHLNLILLKADFLHHTHRSLELQHLPPMYAGMNFCEPETPKPSTFSRILLICKRPWLPHFQDQLCCLFPTATAGIKNILLRLPKQDNCYPREGKGSSGRDCRPSFYSKSYESFSVVVTCARSASGKLNLLISKSFSLTPIPPASSPFPGSG